MTVPSPDREPTPRWLIVRNGALGDTILLSPLIQAIRRHHPQARIELLGNRERLALLTGEGMAERAVALESYRTESLYTPANRLDERFHAYLTRFDHILWFSGRVEPWMTQKLRVREDSWVRVHPALPDPQGAIHAVQHYLAPVRSLLPCDPVPEVRVMIPHAERQAAMEWLRGQGIAPQENDLLAIHAGAGSSAKQVPMEYFHARIHEFRRERERVQLLLIQGPADEAAVARFRQSLSGERWVTVLEHPPLLRLAAVLSCCRQFIGNDSGVSHLAAAVGCPATVYFIRSHPAVWAPVGQAVTVVDLRSTQSDSRG